jgi:hypothetical protein
MSGTLPIIALTRPVPTRVGLAALVLAGLAACTHHSESLTVLPAGQCHPPVAGTPQVPRLRGERIDVSWVPPGFIRTSPSTSAFTGNVSYGPAGQPNTRIAVGRQRSDLPVDAMYSDSPTFQHIVIDGHRAQIHPLGYGDVGVYWQQATGIVFGVTGMHVPAADVERVALGVRYTPGVPETVPPGADLGRVISRANALHGARVGQGGARTLEAKLMVYGEFLAAAKGSTPFTHGPISSDPAQPIWVIVETGDLPPPRSGRPGPPDTQQYTWSYSVQAAALDGRGPTEFAEGGGQPPAFLAGLPDRSCR